MYAFAVECLPERKYNKAEILKEYGGSSMQTVLEAKGLKKYYGKGETEVHALDGVDLEIGTGTFAAIVGTSGSGKSTLLNVISGLEPADAGTVSYNSRNICQMSDKEMTLFRRNVIGYVFQQYFLLPNLNVDKNVKMGADLVKNSNYRKLIEAVGLADKSGKYPHQLSGGEQQRVSIARALAGNPSLILADEPTGALDSKTSREVLDFLKELNREGNTIVIITHDSSIALEARRVVRIHDGKINFDGDVNEYAAIL